jgi:hypothetical protein
VLLSLESSGTVLFCGAFSIIIIIIIIIIMRREAVFLIDQKVFESVRK